MTNPASTTLALEQILQAAKCSGLAHNNGAGGQYLLCATEAQLVAFASALSTPDSAGGAGAEPVAWVHVLKFDGKPCAVDMAVTFSAKSPWSDSARPRFSHEAMPLIYATPTPSPVAQQAEQAELGEATEREAFEKWMLTQGYGPLSRICGPGSPCEGEYANQYWHRSWFAWMARANASHASTLARDFPPMGGLTECDMGDSYE